VRHPHPARAPQEVDEYKLKNSSDVDADLAAALAKQLAPSMAEHDIVKKMKACVPRARVLQPCCSQRWGALWCAPAFVYSGVLPLLPSNVRACARTVTSDARRGGARAAVQHGDPRGAGEGAGACRRAARGSWRGLSCHTHYHHAPQAVDDRAWHEHMLQQVEEDRARSVAAEVERRRVAAENSASQREQRREIERARLLEAERIAQEGEQTKATYMAQEVRAGWGGVVIVGGGWNATTLDSLLC
jgi:hypothetical protein